MGKGRTCRTDIKLFTVTNRPLPPAPLLWLIPSYSPFKEGSFSISSSEKPALTTPTLRSGVIVHLPLQAPSLLVITGCVHVSFAHRSSSCPGRDLSYASYVLASNTEQAPLMPTALAQHGLAGHRLHAQPYHHGLWEQVGTDSPGGRSGEPESQAGRLISSSQPPAEGS